MTSSTLPSDQELESKLPSSPFTPLHIDNTVIQYNGNKAELLGCLFECKEYYHRTGAFRSLIEHGIRATDKTVVVDSIQSVKFATGQVPLARKFSFMQPCPDTVTRINMHNTAASTPGSPSGMAAFVKLDAMPDDYKYTYTVNPFAISDYDQAFFNSLIQICTVEEDREHFTQVAAGSGRKLVGEMIKDAAKASDEDRALCSVTFTNYVQAGLEGEFKFAHFNKWWKKYNSLTRVLPPQERPQDAQIIQMLNNMIFKDPDFRAL